MKEGNRMKKQIEKQAIDEMAKVIERTEQIARDNVGAYPSPTMFAKDLYWRGYRRQEWISVDERLPEDEQMVLTIDTEGEMQVCFYETAREGIFQQFHGLVMIYNITHWMPLPEAPKMKGGAE